MRVLPLVARGGGSCEAIEGPDLGDARSLAPLAATYKLCAVRAGRRRTDDHPREQGRFEQFRFVPEFFIGHSPPAPRQCQSPLQVVHA